MILFSAGYSGLTSHSPYLPSLPSVTTSASYACHVDRWSLLTSPYDVTANMAAANGLHSRLAPYVPTMPYSAYASLNAGVLSPTCTVPSCHGPTLADTMLATMSAVRPMPAHAHSHAHSGLHHGTSLPDMTPLNVDLEAECKRLNSLNSLRLKAKDHTATVQF